VIWCLMCNFDLSKEWPSFRLEWRSFRLDKEQLEALVAGCYNNLSILPCPLARIRGSMLSSKQNSAPFSLFWNQIFPSVDFLDGLFQQRSTPA
jgi:hypothetical protein